VLSTISQPTHLHHTGLSGQVLALALPSLFFRARMTQGLSRCHALAQHVPCVSVCARTHTHARARTHTHARTRTHTRMRAHTHTHAPVTRWPRWAGSRPLQLRQPQQLRPRPPRPRPHPHPHYQHRCLWVPHCCCCCCRRLWSASCQHQGGSCCSRRESGSGPARRWVAQGWTQA